MRLFESLKKKKFILLNIFLTLYIGINFISGERGLVSYLDKKKIYEELENKEQMLTKKLENLERKISLVKNNDYDYLDTEEIKEYLNIQENSNNNEIKKDNIFDVYLNDFNNKEKELIKLSKNYKFE